MLLLSIEVGKYYIWQWGAIGAFLLVGSVQDLKYKALTPIICAVWAGLVLVAVVLSKSNPITCGLGLIPGLLVIICAFASRQAIGYGDGLVIVILGAALGIEKGFCITVMAFLLAAMVALFLLAIKRTDYKQELPFVPFLALSFLIMGVL